MPVGTLIGLYDAFAALPLTAKALFFWTGPDQAKTAQRLDRFSL